MAILNREKEIYMQGPHLTATIMQPQNRPTEFSNYTKRQSKSHQIIYEENGSNEMGDI